MKSVLLALMLILQIASGLSEEFPFSRNDGLSSPVLFVRDVNPKGRPAHGECVRKLYLFADEGYKKREDYSRITCKCKDFLPNSIDGSYKNTRGPLDKRSVMDKGSYLLMKLHPLLHRGVAPTSMNVQNRYRRLGVALGSEFLGKRNIVGKDTESWDVDLESIDGFVGKRAPGTELLGKRWGSEMLGKRNVEMLGKRGGEFLSKRSTASLGKLGYDSSSENRLISRLCKKVEDGPEKYVSCPTPLAKLSEFVEGINAENDTVRIANTSFLQFMTNTKRTIKEVSWHLPE